MIKGRSKAKGNKFEWKICKMLSLWWSNDFQDDIFVPSRMSGGWASTRKKVGKETKSQWGDISLNDPIGKSFLEKFNIELKNYKDFRIDEFLKIKKEGFSKFWKQCKNESEQSSRSPLLIVKRNNFPELLIIELSEFSNLKSYCGEIEPLIKVYNKLINPEPLCIIFLTEFFDKINSSMYN